MSDAARGKRARRAKTVPIHQAPMKLTLTVRDPEVAAALRRYPEGEERRQYALSLLRIAVDVVKHAEGRVAADLLRQESDKLLGLLRGQLEGHGSELRQLVTDYFDPKGGRFEQRVQALIRKDGELERLLERQVGRQDSELAKTLNDHVGQRSPLMRQLDPEDSKGLLGRLSASLESSLADQRRAIVRQFSLDDPESALTRFRREISENNGLLRDDLRASIDGLVGEFSKDNKEGALTRLLKSVEEAQAQITGEFKLERKDSAMARLRAELVRKLDEQGEASREFQGRVESELARLAGRESVIALTPPKGLKFESTVYSVVEQEAQKTGDVAEDVSRKTGKLPRSKVGDFVVVLGEDSAAAGARIVGESKDDKGYSLAQAREELAVGRQNREANVGLFVFSEEAAPKNLRRLRRYGNDIVVVWDHKNRATDVFLEAALSLARALCTRPVVLGSMAAEDFDKIEKAIHEIERQAEGLEEIRRLGSTIENNSKRILSRVEIMSDGFGKQVALLEQKLELLKELMSSVS